MPTQSEIMQALARELINGRGADPSLPPSGVPPGIAPPITTSADSRPFAVEQTPGTSWGGAPPEGIMPEGIPPGLQGMAPPIPPPAPMPAPPQGMLGMQTRPGMAPPVPMPAGPIPPGRWR